MDKDNDKKLSKDEVPERMQSMFARADANKDNELDKDEIAKMAERMAAREIAPI